MVALSEDEQEFFTPNSMASSVTRHALIPLQAGFTFLSAGIDSLDLGGYVEWDARWPKTLAMLQVKKDRAQNTKGLLSQTSTDRKFLHLPTGKPPNYRFHLQFPEYHIYIGITPTPQQAPNVYLSFNAEALWHLGPKRCVHLAESDIKTLGGDVLFMQPSRIDLCADFRIPGDLSLPFLEAHKVSRSRSQQEFKNNGELETIYVGAPGAPIRLRIYNKGKEIEKSGKRWFLSIWGTNEAKAVWRVEYQVRRKALKQFGIISFQELLQKSGGLWSYLTEEWCSFRLPDNDKQDRREVHPWWNEVQALTPHFGKAMKLQRLTESEFKTPVNWYVSHIAGCLPSIAARNNTPSLFDAVHFLNNALYAYWFEKSFDLEYQKRVIKLGKHPKEVVDEND